MTDFFCCEQMREMSECDEYTIQEMVQILGIKFCPFCSYRLSSLD